MEQVRPPTPSERAEQLLTEERARARDRRRDYLVALVGAVGSVGVGLFLIGQAVHTTDVRAGYSLFWAGLLIGNGGWLISMAWAWYRASQRGEM
jgi:hypothetical protein